jgi:hypothetical protein
MVQLAANPKSKAAKRTTAAAAAAGASGDDAAMSTPVQTGSKRRPNSDSDPDLSDPYDPPTAAGASSAAASSGSLPPDVSGAMEAFFLKIDTRITSMQTTLQQSSDQQLSSLSDVITKGLCAVSDRFDAQDLAIEAREVANNAKFTDLQDQITAISTRLSSPMTYAAAAGSAAGPAPLPHGPPSRTATLGQDEACLVFIRGFPVAQPGIVLREYAEEALSSSRRLSV